MKKIFSIILCAAVVLISGCTGVSQEEYNSLVEENSKLTSETDQLKEELENLKSGKADTDDCFEIYTQILGLPDTAISENTSNTYLGGISMETIFYLEKNTSVGKTTVTFDRDLSPEEIATKIKSNEDSVMDTVINALSTGITYGVFIYRYDNGDIIMSHCWYKDDNGDVQAPMFFTSRGEEIGREYMQLTKNVE